MAEFLGQYQDDYEEKSSFIAGIKLATEDVKGKGYKEYKRLHYNKKRL